MLSYGLTSFELIAESTCNINAGLSLRAGGRGFPPATTIVSPGYFETKPKHWKVENTSNNKIVN